MEKVYAFLEALAVNNNRDWFNEHKDRYREALAAFREFVSEIHAGIASFDPSLAGIDPADAIFRIYKDVRFSKDKSPYKTHFGCWMAKGGRKSTDAGYYFHLEPGGTFMAAGSHSPPKEQLNLIRQEIMYNAREYMDLKERILGQGMFERHGEADKLKKGPVGFPGDFEYLDEIKYKHYVFSRFYRDKDILKQGFVERLTSDYRQLFPYVRFLNQAMSFTGNE